MVAGHDSCSLCRCCLPRITHQLLTNSLSKVEQLVIPVAYPHPHIQHRAQSPYNQKHLLLNQPISREVNALTLRRCRTQPDFVHDRCRGGIHCGKLGTNRAGRAFPCFGVERTVWWKSASHLECYYSSVTPGQATASSCGQEFDERSPTAKPCREIHDSWDRATTERTASARLPNKTLHAA